jgi:glyoxylase-like metal-dependent hydrolase (beta-lactamase superfamily II)
MKRRVLVSSLAASLTVFAVTSSLAGAQSSTPDRPLYNPKLPDFNQIQITTTKAAENLYLLEGGPGSTVGVLAGADGIFLVDTNYAQLTDKIVAAIRKISNAPIRAVVNTHVHPDHMAANRAFGKMGAMLFARDELRQRLVTGLADGAGYRLPSPREELPVVTYTGRTTLHLNDEDIELIPIEHAHTDGDTLVRFVASDVLMTGDFFRVVNGYPGFDRNNGGSFKGLVDGLGIVIGLAGPNSKIVPGHGPVQTRDAVIAQRDMMVTVRDRIQSMIRAGRSEAEAIAAKPTREYDAKVVGGPESADRFVRQIYTELKPAN